MSEHGRTYFYVICFLVQGAVHQCSGLVTAHPGATRQGLFQAVDQAKKTELRLDPHTPVTFFSLEPNDL